MTIGTTCFEVLTRVNPLIRRLPFKMNNRTASGAVFWQTNK
ncbi:MAG: hypothetical protein Q8R35_02795 [bacterium]|nr:hypothetical protein [bacterium]